MIVAVLQAVADASPAGMVVAVGLFGLVIGSFLNVVIVRLPEHRSLLRPRSACPRCSAQLSWYDNIPVVSFLILRGRCRACAEPISWRYPIVEAVTAVALVLAYLAFGPTTDFVVAGVLLVTLIAITAIDLQHLLIPDVITLPGILVGLVANVATARISWLESAVGIVLAGALFLTIILVSRGGMGGGDLKLGAMLGAFLGWKALLFALFVAIILGGVLGIALLLSGLRGRKDAVPFGPFLAIGGAAALFWGERVFDWWVTGFGFGG
ncbi:MAG TPA: prepilin peptidase [Gemmatimonadales bacterium]|nr:prepilin peptidase [Gemmatimonadales bacterium]